MSKHIGRLFVTTLSLAASFASGATPTISAQRHFLTPDTAVEALVAANRDNSKSQLLAIFGAQGARLIHSGDTVLEQRGRARFVAAFDEAHKIELESQDRADRKITRL